MILVCVLTCLFCKIPCFFTSVSHCLDATKYVCSCFFLLFCCCVVLWSQCYLLFNYKVFIVQMIKSRKEEVRLFVLWSISRDNDLIHCSPFCSIHVISKWIFEGPVVKKFMVKRKAVNWFLKRQHMTVLRPRSKHFWPAFSFKPIFTKIYFLILYVHEHL